MNSSIEIEFGSSPVEEPCAQVGDPGYELQAYYECTAYVGQLRRMLLGRGLPMPADGYGWHLRIKQNDHDFGSYYEVVGRCKRDDEEALEALVWLENNAPLTWDEEARVLLTR
jgi:hypothetical protein